MTFQKLKYLMAVYHYKSITKAAQHLYISQPSLSRAIREIESEYGITVLERNNQGITFTEEGMELIRYAAEILEKVDVLKERFSIVKKCNKERNLKIASQHYMFPVKALLHTLKEWREEKGYNIYFYEGRTAKVIENVQSHKSEIGILYISARNERFMKRLFAQKGLSFYELGMFHSRVFLCQHHPLGRKETISVDELKEYPYVEFAQGEALDFYSEELLPLELKPEQVIHVNDRSTVFSILRNVPAYTIGSGCIFDDVTGGDIVSIPLAELQDEMKIGWIKSRDKELTPTMQAYVQSLEKSLHDLQ